MAERPKETDSVTQVEDSEPTATWNHTATQRIPSNAKTVLFQRLPCTLQLPLGTLLVLHSQ